MGVWILWKRKKPAFLHTSRLKSAPQGFLNAFLFKAYCCVCDLGLSWSCFSAITKNLGKKLDGQEKLSLL